MSTFTVASILGLADDTQEKKARSAPSKKRLRRNRTAFSDTAVQRLEEVFCINRYPDILSREALGDEIDVCESRIQVWFQNRRSRTKQQKRSKSRGNSTQATLPAATNHPRLPEPQTVSNQYITGSHIYQTPCYYPYSYGYYPAYNSPVINPAFLMSPYGYYHAESTPSSLYWTPGHGYYPSTTSFFSSDTNRHSTFKQTEPKMATTDHMSQVNGISSLTEAARKLSSGSFTDTLDLEQRNTETNSESSFSDNSSSSKSFNSVSTDSSNLLDNEDDDGDDEDKLYIELSVSESDN